MPRSTHVTRSSHHHFKTITRTILLCSIIILGLGYTTTHISANASTTSIPNTSTAFDYVVVILMENHGLSDIIGSATYMTTLSNTYGLATQYTAVSHPSQPNYLALIGGDTFGISSDGNCCWTIKSPNIVDRIENAGLTWQAWAEDASGSGTCNFSPPRSAVHFGFLEFSDINTASRCANFHSTQSSSDSEFVSALNNSPSNFMWLTPNDCDNMHDCSVSTGDTYLAGLVPKILTSNLFITQKASLFVVFDEGNNNYPNDYVYSVWAGSAVKKAYQSSNQYSHYSFLRTVEANWNLPALTSNDANAPAMTEFFNNSPTPSPLVATLAETPTAPNVGAAVNFTAMASGGSLPYTMSLAYGDGVVGTSAPFTHSYSTSGSYTATLTLTDSLSASATSSVSLTVTTTSSPTGFPYVRAWGGILSTEPTADLESTFCLLHQRGYNAARISLADPALGISTFNKPAFDNLLALAKQYNLWLILDDHEYGITNETAWLAFWAPIINDYKNESMIIWQPRNEPSNLAPQLSTFYQDWINQDRNLGDRHWILVSISYGQFRAPNDSTFLQAFPTVTDPLSELAYDFHDYYFYQYHLAWNISDARAYAASVPAAVTALEAFKNAPIMVAEFGADASGSGPSPPDLLYTGSSQYSPESLAYVIAVIQGLDAIKTSYGIWEAGDWAGTGPAGAMNIWGQLIPTPTPITKAPFYALSFQGYDFDGANEETITMNGNLVAPVPSVLTTSNGGTWVSFTFDITSFTVQGLNTISFAHANSDCPYIDQVRNLVVSAQAGAVYYNATAEGINTATNCTNTLSYTFNVGVPPPPPLIAGFSFSPASPAPGQAVSFTATASGGASPDFFTWSFGDGSNSTGASPSHTYSTTGNFTVTMTISDSGSPVQSASVSKTLAVTTPSPTKVNFYLNFQGYDFDGPNEETIVLNGNVVTSLPPLMSPQNGGVWVSFSVPIDTTFLAPGINTLVFTHNNSDCAYNDGVQSLQLLANSTVVFGDPSAYTLNCTTSVTYTFNVGV